MSVVAATRAQVCAYALSKPHATAVRVRRDGQVMVKGKLPRFHAFGWYTLGHLDDLAAGLPLRAMDGDPLAVAAMTGGEHSR